MPRKNSLEDEQLTDTNYYIMLSLVTPLHGYGIMQKVKEMSNQSFEIGPASLYTSLKKLMQSDLICPAEAQEADKKIYQLTDSGKKFLIMDHERRRQLFLCGERILEGLSNEK